MGRLAWREAAEPIIRGPYAFGHDCVAQVPAVGSFGDAVSQQLLVPFADAMLVPVPDGMDLPSIASASDNISDGYRTAAPHLRRRPGAPVLIVGGATARSARVDHGDILKIRVRRSTHDQKFAVLY